MNDPEYDSYDDLRKKILGLGDSSFRKTYYPVLRHKQMELERFRIILDHINDIVFLISYPGCLIVDFNIRAADKMGFRPEEIIGSDIAGFLFDDSGKPVSLNAMKDKADRVLIRGEVGCRQGGRIPVEADLSFTDYGDETYCAVICRDISERIQMEKMIFESESQYRTTIEAITDGILVVNSSGRSVICNRAFKDQYLRYAGRVFSSKIKAKDFFKKIGLFDEDELDPFMDSDGFEEKTGKIILGDKMAVLKIRKMPLVHEFRHGLSVLVLSDITQGCVLDEIRRNVFYQLSHNMEQFAILNDEIRNPLQALLGTIELKNPLLADEIQPFINEINLIVRRLDMGWLESGKVRTMIKKHYGVSVLDKDEIGDAVLYLKEFGNDEGKFI